MVADGSLCGWRISSVIDNTIRVQVELAHALRITECSQIEAGALIGQSCAAPLTVCLTAFLGILVISAASALYRQVFGLSGTPSCYCSSSKANQPQTLPRVQVLSLLA